VSDIIQLRPAHVDCATAVMLKILDGKCKMSPVEKVIMEQLYDDVKTQTSDKLRQKDHDFIAQARKRRDEEGLDDDVRNQIYEQRLYAETMISRPVMKDFKRMLRQCGVLPKKEEPADV
jgi:hypothetical protein